MDELGKRTGRASTILHGSADYFSKICCRSDFLQYWKYSKGVLGIKCGYRSLLANIGEQVNETNIHCSCSLQIQVILYLEQSGDAKLIINFTECKDVRRTTI